MGTSSPLAAPGMPAPKGPTQEAASEAAVEQALVTTASTRCEDEPTALDGAVARLPAQLDVAIPVRNFRVRHLLALERGAVVESQWCSGDDLPLTAGEVQLAWSEFEVLDAQLAVRITNLA